MYDFEYQVGGDGGHVDKGMVTTLNTHSVKTWMVTMLNPRDMKTGMVNTLNPHSMKTSLRVQMRRPWWPFTPEEPDLDPDLLAGLDFIADRLEDKQLQEMDVLVDQASLTAGIELGGDLTARFVRSWRRKKAKGKEEFWL